MNKYDLLALHLSKIAAKSRYEVKLKFSEVGGILEFELPPSAFKYSNWWSNSRSNGQARAWLDVGWKVQRVDMVKREVTFVHEVRFIIDRVVDKEGESSLEAVCSPMGFTLVLRGPGAWAYCPFRWRKTIQVLIDLDPDMFGILAGQRLHEVFPITLGKLGYHVTDWKGGKSWAAQSPASPEAKDATRDGE